MVSHFRPQTTDFEPQYFEPHNHLNHRLPSLYNILFVRISLRWRVHQGIYRRPNTCIRWNITLWCTRVTFLWRINEYKNFVINLCYGLAPTRHQATQTQWMLNYYRWYFSILSDGCRHLASRQARLTYCGPVAAYFETRFTRPRGPFDLHGLTLIPAWISNHKTSKVLGE